MKRILLATSLLASSVGFASAEVTVSGSARMGLIYDGTDTLMTSRVRIVFTASGETDGGLSFGASVRNDQSGQGNTANGDSTVYVSGAFGKLTFGDVDGAAGAAVGHVDGVGLTGLGDLNEIIFIGNGGTDIVAFDAGFTGTAITADTSALYEYSTGDLSLYVGFNQFAYVWPTYFYDTDRSYSVGAAYTMGDYKFGIGYEQIDVSDGGTEWQLDQISVGADATFGAVTLKARYATGGNEGNNGFSQDNEQWALSGTFTADALSVTAFASDLESSQSGVVVLERQAYGLGAAYDLGGGAKVVGGYVKNQTDDTEAADVGLSFSF